MTAQNGAHISLDKWNIGVAGWNVARGIVVCLFLEQVKTLDSVDLSFEKWK